METSTLILRVCVLPYWIGTLHAPKTMVVAAHRPTMNGCRHAYEAVTSRAVKDGDKWFTPEGDTVAVFLETDEAEGVIPAMKVVDLDFLRALGFAEEWMWTDMGVEFSTFQQWDAAHARWSRQPVAPAFPAAMEANPHERGASHAVAEV